MSNWSQAVSARTHLVIVADLKAAKTAKFEAEQRLVDANLESGRATKAYGEAFERVLQLERELDAYVAGGVF